VQLVWDFSILCIVWTQFCRIRVRPFSIMGSRRIEGRIMTLESVSRFNHHAHQSKENIRDDSFRRNRWPASTNYKLWTCRCRERAERKFACELLGWFLVYLICTRHRCYKIHLKRLGTYTRQCKYSSQYWKEAPSLPKSSTSLSRIQLSGTFLSWPMGLWKDLASLAPSQMTNKLSETFEPDSGRLPKNLQFSRAG